MKNTKYGPKGSTWSTSGLTLLLSNQNVLATLTFQFLYDPKFFSTQWGWETGARCSLCLECPVLWLHILQMSAPRNSLLYIPKPSIIFCPIIHYSLPFCIFRLVTPFLYRFLACEFEGRGCVCLSVICVDRGDWQLQSVGPYRVGHNTMHVSSIPRSEPGSSENT